MYFCYSTGSTFQFYIRSVATGKEVIHFLQPKRVLKNNTYFILQSHEPYCDVQPPLKTLTNKPVRSKRTVGPVRTTNNIFSFVEFFSGFLKYVYIVDNQSC